MPGHPCHSMSTGMESDGHSWHPGRSIAAGVVVVAMLVAALSLWTAIPLTWVYIGSQLSDTQFPSIGPYMVVLVGVIVSIVLVAWLLGRLNGLYVRITGTTSLSPMRPSWLRSMRDTSGGAPADSRQHTTVIEAVVLGSVILAGVVVTFWFFFLAGSPLPGQ